MPESINGDLAIVRLGGTLGRKFGKEHKAYVSSPAEAVRMLCVNYPEFLDYMADENNQTQYKVLVRGVQIDPESQLHELSGSKEIRIEPVIQGAKRGGLFQAMLGVALIALASTPLGAYALPALGAKATTGTLLFNVGLGLALGGVAQLLSPQPKMDMVDPPENSPNKSFSGVVNTVGSGGHPVPLAYGELICGSATISAGMYASDINR